MASMSPSTRAPGRACCCRAAPVPGGPSRTTARSGRCWGIRACWYCHVAEAWLTRIKFSGSYTISRVDVQVSGSLRSEPAPGEGTARQEIAANYQATTAEVRPSLGRDLAGGARNVTVNLIATGSDYGERANQVDLRLAKILRFGGTRTTVSADIYNVLNSNAVQTQNITYGPAWQRPTAILRARFIKFNAQFDF